MKFIDLVHELSTQIASFFQERRCVLCHAPFHPKQHSKQHFAQNSMQYTEYLFAGASAPIIDTNILNKSTSHTNKDYFAYNGSNENNCYENGNNNNNNNNAYNNDVKEQKIFLLQLIKLATQHVQSNLCPDCAKEIDIKTKGFCPLCGELFTDEHMLPILCANCAQVKPPWDNFVFLGEYKTSLRELLLKSKFHNSNSCLSFLGKLIAHVWLIHLHSRSLLTNNQIEYPSHVIPMPLHNKRLKERGYNQCVELTKFFIKELNSIFSKCQYKKPEIMLDYTSLIRTSFNQAQSALSSKERISNVKNAFTAENMCDKHVLIIDDIATTNSTLKEASLTLKKAGARKVDIFVLAKASLFSHK